jgi:hypothetical protein
MTAPREPSPAQIAETVDHVAISRLQARYADTITRRALPELAAMFLPDAPLHLELVTSPARDLAGPIELASFIGGAMGRFSFFEAVVLNSHIELYPDDDPDCATARLWMCEIRCEGEGDAATDGWSTAYGLYRDRYERLDGRWWFARRHYRSLARSGVNGMVLPCPGLPDGPTTTAR